MNVILDILFWVTAQPDAITVTKYTKADKFPIPADNCCLRERWEDAAGF